MLIAPGLSAQQESVNNNDMIKKRFIAGSFGTKESNAPSHDKSSVT
jgi:hypothetical protein